jgi:hypothetical protein
MSERFQIGSSPDRSWLLACDLGRGNGKLFVADAYLNQGIDNTDGSVVGDTNLRRSGPPCACV